MKRKSILLVDDVELFIHLEQSILAREDFTLHTARSGKEALEKARSLRPDLVLLDLYMPDLDGDQVCRILKDTAGMGNTAVVMVSSDSVEETRRRCFEAGCDAFVVKPLERDPLLRTIEEMLKVAQRKSPRLPVRLDCRLRSPAGETDAVIHCLSGGGLFVAGAELARGTLAKVSFKLGPTGPLLSAEAVVRWIGTLTRESVVQGMGMEFRGLGSAERDAIRAFIEGKRKVTQSLSRFS